MKSNNMEKFYDKASECAYLMGLREDIRNQANELYTEIMNGNISNNRPNRFLELAQNEYVLTGMIVEMQEKISYLNFKL